VHLLNCCTVSIKTIADLVKARESTMPAQSRAAFGLRGSLPPEQEQPPIRGRARLIGIVLALSVVSFVAINFCLGHVKFYYRFSASGPSDLSQLLDRCSGKENPPADQIISACTALIDSGRGNAHGLSEAAYNRGNAYARIGDYDHAIADYDQAIRLNPTMALAFDNRGRAYSEKNQFERAIADYDQAIRLNPNFANALHNRCWARVALGDTRGALSDCNESLRLKPQNAGALSTRGFVFLRAGAFDKAVADYEAALQSDPQMAGLRLAVALYGRGLAKQKQHDPGANRDIAAAKGLIPDIAGQFARYGVQ
jgi:tetratricopeptide (TPR) repeat protein